MSERENNVYKAKLAEQAERYDGELKFSSESSYFYVKNGKFKAATLKNYFFINGFRWPEQFFFERHKNVKTN